MPSRSARPRFLTLRIAVWRARRALTVLAVLAVAFGLARQLAPAAPRTEPVVVVARSVEAGQELRRADLRIQAMPSRWVPDEAVRDPTPLVARRTAVALPRGLPVVESALEGERFGIDPPPGTVVVAITVSSAAAGGMLRPGDVVDVVPPATAPGQAGADLPIPGDETAPQHPAVLARSAVVLHLGSPPAESVMPDLLAPEPTEDLTAVVAVTPAEGRLLAAAATWGPLGTVLVP